MAYDPNTKIITAPVGIADLQQCFAVRIEANVTIDGQTKTINVLSGDIGVNCALETGDTFIADYTYRDALGTHVIPNVTWTVVSRNEINKWAKYKPVRYNLIRPLTDNEFAHQTFIENGVTVNTYYGLKISQHVATLSALLHQTTYDYYKPIGGADSPYRLTDFVRADTPRNYGYYHLAMPSINATMQWVEDHKLFTTDTYPIEVRLDYAPDSNSVDIFDLGNQRPTTSQRFYCCCMLTVGNMTYWRPMFLGTRGETPAQSTVGVINLADYPSNPVFFADIPASVKLLNTNGTLTIFLMDVADVTAGGYSTDWNELSNVEQYELAWTPLAAPGAIGMNVTVKPQFATVTFDTVIIRNTGIRAVVEVSGSFSEIPDDTSKYSFGCTLDGTSVPLDSISWITRQGEIVGFFAEYNTGYQSLSGSHTVHLTATRTEGLNSWNVGTFDGTITPTN